MNLLKRKMPLFCISNIMVSLVSTNIASATYTYKEEQNAIVYKQMEVATEDLEPVSHNGDKDEIVAADEVPMENVVVQREVTGTMNYVPARYSEVTGQAVVDYAKRYLGLRYVSGGYSLSTGTDCSGFTKLIYSEFGVYLPRTVSGQMYSGSYVRRDDLRKGDIIIYGNGSGYAVHVGIYIGDNLVLHESTPRDGVKISGVNMMQYITARRVINDTAIDLVEKQIEEAQKVETPEETNTIDDTENSSLDDNESNVDDTSESDNQINEVSDTNPDLNEDLVEDLGDTADNKNKEEINNSTQDNSQKIVNSINVINDDNNEENEQNEQNDGS